MGGRGASGGGATAGRAPRLPDLTGTGSEKQVNWANSIRQNALSHLDFLSKRLDEYANRWAQSLSRSGNLSKREAEKRAMQRAEADMGYSKVDVETAKADLVRTMQDQRAANAKFIIDKRNVLSADFITSTVKTYARRRRNR